MTCIKSTRDVIIEQNNALKDVQQTACEYGVALTIKFRAEGQITRDKYNSIKKFNTDFAELPVYAASFDYDPNSYKLEKAGQYEKVNALAYVPTKFLIDAGYTVEDIDVSRTTVIHESKEYRIKQPGRYGQIGNVYLYFTLGLFKE